MFVSRATFDNSQSVCECVSQRELEGETEKETLGERERKGEREKVNE